MSKDQSATTLVHSSTSLHARLHKHIDEYEQEFQVRNKTIEEYLQNNIKTLRKVVDETIGEAYLLDRFAKSVASMRTWEDIFSGICQNDLTIKYYMGIVLDQIGKDSVIKNLEKKHQMEIEKNTSIEGRYESQLSRIQQLHTQQLEQVDAAYKKLADMQKCQLDSATQEMQVMKKQLHILQERMIQGDSHKIASLTQQNMQQLQLIGELQRELLRHRPQTLGTPTAEPKVYQTASPYGGEKVIDMPTLSV
jgi:putative lipoic acid-binding regulatory protein